MRIFKIFVIFFVSIFLPYHISHGFGPSNCGFRGYSFLNENIVNTKAAFAPYFLRFDDLYTRYDSIHKIQSDENLREWNERFCNLFKTEELRSIIYTSNILDLRRLGSVAKGLTSALPSHFLRNDFAMHLVEQKCLETIQYLAFAKECEPFVIPSEVGWSTPKRDTIGMRAMIEKGEKEFKKTKSHYIRLRYAYQIIRLAHYSKKYQKVLDLHDKLMTKVHAHPSLIDYWIMGHKAGALQRLKRNVEAAYLYAQIYTHCPSKRQSAYQSFYIKNDKEWDELLLLCKSDQERAMLYALRANSDDSKVVEEMDKIYQYDPSNENLELLMVKEVFKLEKDLLGKDFNDNRLVNLRKYKIPRKQVGKYLYTLRNFVDKCIRDGKVNNKDVWATAAAYLTFLAGDYYEAGRAFEEIKNKLPQKETVLKEQLDVFQLALKIVDLGDDMDNEDEDEIGDIIRDNELYWKYKDFPDFINDKLADVYFRTNSKGKAFRVHHSVKALKMNPKMDIINDLLRICRKKEKSSLEKVLVKKNNVSTIEYDLIDLKSTLLFNQGEIEAALELFKQIPRNERELQMRFNPFHEHLKDCVHCPMADTLKYDKAGVIDEILKLEYSGRANLGSGASYFYQLGNAYYNMTYFGDSWEVTDFYRSGMSWQYSNPQNKYSVVDSELGNVENMNFERARVFYNRALEIAKNPELAARIRFMLAKCDLNEFYIDPETKYRYKPKENQMPIIPSKYLKQYEVLINNYSETEFYKEIIKECKFFKAYALK